mmetsp:Transcript_34087/g.90885  ORF Transcript_34087/g.90885 Transcript_34087/m.90885 type:complete len:258 (-) Transcript_34087:869-1642(-)
MRSLRLLVQLLASSKLLVEIPHCVSVMTFRATAPHSRQGVLWAEPTLSCSAPTTPETSFSVASPSEIRLSTRQGHLNASRKHQEEIRRYTLLPLKWGQRLLRLPKVQLVVLIRWCLVLQNSEMRLMSATRCATLSSTHQLPLLAFSRHLADRLRSTLELRCHQPWCLYRGGQLVDRTWWFWELRFVRRSLMLVRWNAQPYSRLRMPAPGSHKRPAAPLLFAWVSKELLISQPTVRIITTGQSAALKEVKWEAMTTLF